MTATSQPAPSQTVTPLPNATILGYPRIGRRRELKRAIESFWKGATDEAQLGETARELRAATRTRLVELGLPATGGAVPESFSFYDQVLDATIALGAIPHRFADAVGSSDLTATFALARGDKDHQPLEMTKWFDTNYHYSVPELDEQTPLAANSAALVSYLAEAKEQGIESRPVLVGPVTYALLAKASDAAGEGFAPLDRLDEIVAVYAQLLADLAAAGAAWVQLDEPALVSDSLSVPRAEILALVERTYATLGGASARPAILLTAPYGDSAAALSRLAALPIEAVQADLVRGSLPESELADGSLAAAFEGTQFVAGVVDGRNIWRTNLRAALATATRLQDAGIATVIGTSNSLQHVPHDVSDETKLDARLRSWLAFADQKVEQVAILAKGLADAASVEAELAEVDAVLADRAAAPGVSTAAIRDRAAAVTAADRDRAPEGDRRDAQRALNIPELATTTIGSFPQTSEIRVARAAFARGEIDQAAYDGFLRAEIERVIRLQEEIGLDVLVHGEAERNDMVQYFAELLDGFAVTEHGWVQSYGTRATRPSILWGDVSRPAPMTVAWSVYAQSLTERPVKGMLTGPVTILAWSFVRDDLPLADTASQVALALRDEINDLVEAGIKIVQVDEPALRELLPLDADRQAAYLDWSVGAFRLATAGAASEVQIHTHLCYSEFGEIIDAVDGLDADVTSIEAARSRMDVVEPLGDHGYSRGIGPGVYDIHSPRVPSVAEQTELIQLAAARIPGEQLWVNPDCGLKTRGYEETVASLTNLVQAARAVRGA